MSDTFSYLYENLFNNINFELYWRGYVRLNSSWSFKTALPVNRLYLVTDGEAVLKNQYEEVHLLPGNIYLIPLGIEHEHSCETFEKMFIHFSLEITSGIDIFSYSNKIISIPSSVDYIKQINEKMQSFDPKDLITCKSILLDIISKLLDLVKEDLEPCIMLSSKYAPLLRYINQNLYNNITLEELGAELNINPDSLSKRFKNDTGLSLKKFIDTLKFNRIKKLLVTTDYTIKSLSDMFQFSDEFYFSKFFKKMTGISPKEYRGKNLIAPSYNIVKKQKLRK